MKQNLTIEKNHFPKISHAHYRRLLQMCMTLEYSA